MGQERKTTTRILLTGGGSGGHVTPLLAIADALRERDEQVELHYMGVRHGLEATIVPREEIPMHFAPSIGMPGRLLSPRMLRFALTLGAGVMVALGHLLRIKPDAVVASGGYASAPTVFAAALLRRITFGIRHIPIYMHEQNAVPGRMNRLAGRIVDRIGVSHPTALDDFRGEAAEVVGYPVRSTFKAFARQDARRDLELSEDDFYILVFGGSQGARTLNRAFVDALPELSGRESLVIMHACGKIKSPDYDSVEDTRARLAELADKPKRYKLVDYLHDMPLHLAAADLAVIRAGAGSLVEVCSAGVPAVVIPKANLPGDSQVANARDLASRGVVEVIYEEPALEAGKMIEAVSGHKLARRLGALIDDDRRRRRLSQRARANVDRYAARRIAHHVLELAGGDAGPEPDNGMNDHDLHDPTLSARATATSPTTLRRRIETTLGVAWERAFEVGRISDEAIARLEDLDYLRYRGSALLVHSAWALRNEGVKIVGLTRHEAQRRLLAHMLTDRTPAPLTHRILGGDFQQVGFIRRNVLFAFALIGVYDDPVVNAVRVALDDPYYEVRSAALKLVRRMVRAGVELEDVIREAVGRHTEDSNLEVRWEAVHTFGLVGQPREVLDACRRYALASEAPLREAVLRAYHALCDRCRGDEPWREEMLEDLDRFAITSVSFHPHFPLKERYATLRKRLAEEARS